MIDNLPKIKDGTHVINFDDKQSKGIHWVSLLINKNTAVVFDTFGIEYIPEEILSQIKDKTIAHNIFRIQSYGTVMCGSYCMALIEYMIAGKTLLDSTNLFSPNDNEKNCEIIHKLF